MLYLDDEVSLTNTNIPSKQAGGKVPSCLTEVLLVTYHIAKDLRHPGQFTEQAMKQEIFIENICDLVMWH